MSAADRRAALLAAAESRLRGEPSAHDLEAQAAEAKKTKKEEVWVQPTEKQDAETKRNFGRLLDRGIIRDNGYKQTADAVETLLTIANNILNNNDPKFRTLKSTSNVLRNKVLNVKGGHDYLIAMGFRTQTVDFIMVYVLEPRLKRMHELRLGADVLESRLDELKTRVNHLNSSNVNHKSEEALRKERALRDYEEDRDQVKARVERERRSREYREKMKREDEEKAKREELELEALAEDNKADPSAATSTPSVVEGGHGAASEGETVDAPAQESVSPIQDASTVDTTAQPQAEAEAADDHHEAHDTHGEAGSGWGNGRRLGQ